MIFIRQVSCASVARRSSHHSSRRRGQALLIAVLLMVFAAVLGATFVTVVAANLNQTARSSNKSSARRAVESGVRFVRFKLQSEGLRWRPKTDAPPPQPDEASFPFYSFTGLMPRRLRRYFRGSRLC